MRRSNCNFYYLELQAARMLLRYLEILLTKYVASYSGIRNQAFAGLLPEIA